MDEIIIGILAIILIVFLLLVGLGIIAGLLFSAISAACAGVVGFFAGFIPISENNWSSRLVRNDARIGIQGDFKLPVIAKVWRFALIISAGLAPSFYLWLNDGFSLQSAASGEDKIVGAAGIFSFVIASAIFSIAIATWSIERTRKKAFSEIVVPYSKNIVELMELLDIQEKMLAKSERTNFDIRDYMQEFDETLIGLKINSSKYNLIASIRATAHRLVENAKIDLERLFFLEKTLSDCQAASHLARKECDRSANFDLKEQCKELESLHSAYRYRRVSNQNYEEYIDSLNSLLDAFESLKTVAHSVYQRRREESRAQWTQEGEYGQTSSKRASHKGQSSSLPEVVIRAKAILGLPFDSEYQELRAAYLSLRSIYHPDTGGKHANPEKFHAVQAAWEILKNYFEWE